MTGYDMQVIIWENSIPKIDRAPVEITSEEDGKTMIRTVAQEKANEHKLEVSTALYQDGRYIASHRALPELGA